MTAHGIRLLEPCNNCGRKRAVHPYVRRCLHCGHYQEDNALMDVLIAFAIGAVVVGLLFLLAMVYGWRPE